MRTGNKAETVLGAAGTIAVLGVSAYRFGFFYDRDFYRLELLLYALAAAVALAALIGRRTTAGRDPAAGGGAPIAWASVLPLGLAAVYAWALLLGPLSVKGTADAALRWTAFACWTLLLWRCWRHPDGRRLGEAALQATGAFVVLGGLAGWFGWLSFPDIVFRSADEELTATGARLAGFLQYPNTFGAVIAFFLLVQWQALARRRGAAFAALVSVPYGTALLLTESRGAWLALLAGAALALLLHAQRAGAGERDAGGRFAAAAGMTAALSALGAQAALHSPAVGGGGSGMWPAAATLGCTALGALLLAAVGGVRLPGRRAGGTTGGAARVPGWMGALALGVGAAALVGAFANGMGGRWTGHYGTAFSRWLYYEDALAMFADRPWFGAGGEAWRMLVGLYRSAPYVSGEAHSGYLELLVEGGLLGLAALLGMFGYAVRRLWRRAPHALPPLLALLAHAAIDFDWSYGYVWLLTLAWIALHLAGTGGRARGLAAGRAAAAVMLACAVAAAPFAWRSLQAAEAREAAAALPPAAREAHLREALEADPAWIPVRLELAPLLPARERAQLLETGLRYEPASPPLWLALGLARAGLGDAAGAEEALCEALRLDRYDADAFRAAIAAMARLADDGADGDAETAARAAVALYERYRELDAALRATHGTVYERQFALWPGSTMQAAEAWLRLGERERARELLEELAAGESAEWRERARERLVRLEREG